MRIRIAAEQSPPPSGPYSPGLAHGGVLYLAGQGPFNAAGERVGETFAEQVHQTFANLQANAEAAGTTLHNALRYGVYLRSLDDFAEFNELARGYFVEPFPVRTTIEAALRGFDVEIDAIVAIPE